MLIDAHTHLDMKEFDPDRDEVIERARSAGLVAIVTVGVDPESCRAALKLAVEHDFIYCSLGMHPHDAAGWNEETREELGRLLNRPKVVAVGETGLDYFRNRSPRDVQRKAFIDHVRLAVEYKLPVVVHDRDAHDEVLEILKSEQAERAGGIIHCFSGDVEMARKCLDMGFYLSIPGIVTFPKAEILKDVVRFAPLDRLLVETDAPYLAPVPFRGKRNEPAYVAHTLAELARVKDLDRDEAAEATTRNARAVYSIPS